MFQAAQTTYRSENSPIQHRFTSRQLIVQKPNHLKRARQLNSFGY